jgi:putative transposase
MARILIERQTRMAEDTIHHRRSTRIIGYDYRQAGAYFVTICSFQRQPIFGKLVDEEVRLSPIGQFVKDHWLAIPANNSYIDLDLFVVMPNHIHGILWIHKDQCSSDNTYVRGKDYRRNSGSLGRIIGSFKGACTRRVQQAFPLSKIDLWQRNYYEHIVRNDADLQRIKEYILHNPVELLVKHTEGSPWESPYTTPDQFDWL